MTNATDEYQVMVEPQVGFKCGACGEWNYSDDTLELQGDHVDDTHVESDRVYCCKCNTENFIYR
jgi:hypothetical protein